MNKTEQKFVATVWRFYEENGRHHLPWRKTKNPYRILVSEIMLQQTQVDRVLPKYKNFLKKFPTAAKLADASLGDVLREWQGLGYNRRAKLLHQCARTIIYDSAGRWPKTYEELKELPGIGPYTAGAVMAFAYNEAVPLIETNIRSVYLHHFFKNKTGVPDEDILQKVEHTLQRDRARGWYAALMDYGVYIKKMYGNPNQASKSYIKQSTFAGSDRHIRGALLKLLSEQHMTSNVLVKRLYTFEADRVQAQLIKLVQEEMLIKKGKTFQLP